MVPLVSPYVLKVKHFAEFIVAQPRFIKLQGNFIKRSKRIVGATKPRSITFLTTRKKFYPGFTLLEMMVSLAILATAFSAVLKLHSDSIEMVLSSRVHTKAADLAQYKMTEIETGGIKNISFMSGRFDEYAPEYIWRISIEPTPIKGWSKVTVSVSNRNIDKGGEFHLTEYMLSSPLPPPPSGGRK